MHMFYFDLPPTHDRYIAEVKNLLNMRCRPLCILGQPRASLRELRRALGGWKYASNALVIGESVVALSNEYTVIYDFH